MKQLLIQEVKQDLHRLKLNDMANSLDDALSEAGKKREGHLNFFANLIKIQIKARDERSLERRIKKANFPEICTFENFDWNFQPGLNVEYIKDLSQLDFIQKKYPLLILGKNGTGKTHLAVSFGIRACSAQYRVGFYSAQNLLKYLYKSLEDDSTDQVITELTKLNLLIIDALGSIRSKKEYPGLLFDLISACRSRVSILVTSSMTFEEWGKVMGNVSVTSAIVDRLFEHAALINIKGGRSYRTEGPHYNNRNKTKNIPNNFIINH